MTITFHHFFSPSGHKIEYARIQFMVGKTLVGQTLSLHRLSAELKSSNGKFIP